MIIEATAWEESEQECRATNTYIPDNNKFIEEANYDTSNAETNGITIPFIWGRWVPRQMGTRVFRVCFTLMNQSTFFSDTYSFLTHLHFKFRTSPFFYFIFNKSLAILVFLEKMTANEGSQSLCNVCGDRVI